MKMNHFIVTTAKNKILLRILEVTREEILGFDRTSYVGSLENNTVQLEPIILSEGFTSAVTFTLHGGK